MPTDRGWPPQTSSLAMRVRAEFVDVCVFAGEDFIRRSSKRSSGMMCMCRVGGGGVVIAVFDATSKFTSSNEALPSLVAGKMLLPGLAVPSAYVERSFGSLATLHPM